jgi:hypothetical protein
MRNVILVGVATLAVSSAFADPTPKPIGAPFTPFAPATPPSRATVMRQENFIAKDLYGVGWFKNNSIMYNPHTGLFEAMWVKPNGLAIPFFDRLK